MTKKEKRDNARTRVVQKTVETVLFISGAREVVEGPRGNELLQVMKNEVYNLLAQYEEKYVLALDADE